MTTHTEARCPECEGRLELPAGELMPNEIVPCGECGVELEVTSVEPLRLSLAPEVEEDWGE